MRYNPVLHKKSRASRRGIAVMFALGILSLVIIAVLIFSHRAVIDRKVASAYSHYSGSKDLAQSAFGRALLQLKKNAATEDYFYSSGTEDYDWLWKLDPNQKFLESRASFPISWQYVNDSDGHIIGRYAYIVFGSNQLNLNAIMDHSFCPADSKCNGGTKIECPRAQRLGNTATELQFDPSRFTGWFSATFDKDKVQDIKGQYEGPEYLFMGASPKLSPASGVSVADAINRLSTWFTVSRSSALKEPDAWFGGDVSPTNDVKDKDEYYQRFLLNKTAEQWNTIAAKSGAEGGGASKSDRAVNEILKDAVSFYSGDTPNPVNTAGIPWLKNWTDTEGNWTSASTKAKQIAANLINYCASGDSPVVSDVVPSKWRVDAPTYTNRPSYTGNKCTWYLNECGIQLQLEVIPGNPKEHSYKDGSETKRWYSFGDKSGSKNKLRINLAVLPELINMYGNDVLEGTYSVNARMNYEFEYTHVTYTDNTSSGTNNTDNFTTFTWGRDTGQTLGCTPSTTKTRSTSSDATIATGYQTFKFTKDSLPDVDYVQRTEDIEGSFAYSTNTPPASVIESLFKVKNIRIYNLHIIVTRKHGGVTENVDYAWMPEIKLTPAQAIKPSTLMLEKYLVANDPRHNLNPEDWAISDTGTLEGTNTGTVTSTGATWSEGTGWNRDPETASNPANKSISTAYIRHAPMESLWELGAIHRAAPWQTINLKKPGSCSDTLTTNLTTAGGGAYGKGDFRILDQVTMQGGTSYTPEAAFGKINLYKQSKFTFDALFRGMPWSASGKYDLSGTTTALTTSGTLAEKLALTSSIPLYRRSDIYQTPTSGAASGFWNLIEKSPVDGTTALTTDAQQEQLVGRFIGLTTADAAPGDATVIVLAQSIQDLGDGAVVYREGWDKVLAGYHYNKPGDAADATPSAHSKLGDSAYSSSIPSAAYGTYDNGADRITGETKLVGRLLYDRKTKKWKIVQVKYED